MMSKLLLIISVLFFTNILADDTKSAITKLAKTFEVDPKNISPTPFDGVFEIVFHNPIQSILISKDGKYLIQGDVIDLTSREKMPTSKKIKQLKTALLNSIKDEDKIIFKAKNEKYIIHAFTDVDCPFCKKLHAGMEKMNDLGISVKYLASPLASLHPTAQNTMEKIWCADDRIKAMHDYKTKDIIPLTKSCKNPVAAQLKIAQQLGVQGTPALFLADGTHLPGYIPPKRLLTAIEKNLVKK